VDTSCDTSQAGPSLIPWPKQMLATLGEHCGSRHRFTARQRPVRGLCTVIALELGLTSQA